VKRRVLDSYRPTIERNFKADGGTIQPFQLKQTKANHLAPRLRISVRPSRWWQVVASRRRDPTSSNVAEYLRSEG